MATISKVRKNLNQGLSLLGVIINEYDSKPTITKQIKDEIKDGFGDKVFETLVSRSIKLEEAVAGKIAVVSIDKTKSKDEVIALGNELLKRLEDSTNG
jgi:chromosome partitioning protein